MADWDVKSESAVEPWGVVSHEESPDITNAPKKSAIPPAISDIWPEIKETSRSALNTIGDTLNPFSEARHAAYERAAKAPSLLGTMGEIGKQTLDTGAGLATIPALPAAPIRGAAHSLIGHPYSEMTGIPYEEAKGDVDTALSAMAPRGFRPNGPAPAVPVKIAAPSSDALKDVAGAGYDKARDLGVEFSPKSIQDFGSKVSSAMNEDGIDEILAPKTFGILGKLNKIPEDGVFTINNYRTLQRSLGNAAKSPDPVERLAAMRAKNELDGFLEDIPLKSVVQGTPEQAEHASQIIKEANRNYAAAKRSDMVQGKIDLAEFNTSTANSGQNLDNAIRQQVKTILRNEKLQRGFSDEELDQMRLIAKGTAPGNILRKVGNILGGGGGLGTFVTAAEGMHAVGPAGAAAPVGGWIAKSIGNALTAKQAAKLDEMVRSNSPLARSLTDLAQKKLAAEASPSPSSYASMTVAVGNLAQWMSNHGFRVTSRDIFRSLQAPAPAGAQENQPNVPRPLGQQQNGGKVEEPGSFAHGGSPHGARLAPDGHHYLADPNRPGKYLRIVHRKAS